MQIKYKSALTFPITQVTKIPFIQSMAIASRVSTLTSG